MQLGNVPFFFTGKELKIMKYSDDSPHVNANCRQFGSLSLLGDPNDNTLRKIEEDVVIPEKLRKISRQKKCPDLVKAFSKCGEDAGLLISIKCEDERKALVDCLVKWFHDKDLKEEVTKEYLRERAIYRQTGMNVEQQEHLEGIRKKAREKFWEDYEKKKQEKLESENKENT